MIDVEKVIELLRLRKEHCLKVKAFHESHPESLVETNDVIFSDFVSHENPYFVKKSYAAIESALAKLELDRRNESDYTKFEMAQIIKACIDKAIGPNSCLMEYFIVATIKEHSTN